MLPPYPGGTPLPQAEPLPQAAPLPPSVPAAEATQMLPPYPGGDPAAHQPYAGPMPGAVPPPPPMPPQGPPQMAPIPQPGAAEATQALPFFQDEQPGPDYGGQPYGQQQYDQSGGYGQQAGYDQYPAPGGGPSYGGQAQYPGQFGGFEDEPQQPGPGQDSDYDHLFRNDVPSPAPIRPRIIQPPDRSQGAQPYAQGAGGQPPYGQPGYGTEQGGTYDGDEGGRKTSPKAVIGIVVACCVVAGLVVGALLNSGGGGGGGTHTVADSDSSAPATSASSSTGSDGADAAVKQQAAGLDSLLNTSDASRTSVVNAVAAIRGCDNLSGAATDLHTAATQRKSQVTQLAKLPVDKLPDHADLTNALTKAWQASSAADSHYASWAGQAEKNKKVCKGGHAKNTSETQAGDKQSGTATTEKKKAVKLWNSIASKYGLTKRQYSQL
jgi:hypothetical protein